MWIYLPLFCGYGINVLLLLSSKPLCTTSNAPQRLTAHHHISVLRRLRSYLQYIRIVKYAKAAETMSQLQEMNLAWWRSWIGNHAFVPVFPWQVIPTPVKTTLSMHILHTRHTHLDYITIDYIIEQYNVHPIRIMYINTWTHHVHHVHNLSCAGVCNGSPTMSGGMLHPPAVLLYCLVAHAQGGGEPPVWWMLFCHLACVLRVSFCLRFQ
jgi:hypothetical protein